MSNSDGEDGPLLPADQPLRITRRLPLPHPGKGLIFSEAFAQEVSEFVASPFFKKLKRNYGLQAKDRAARNCLDSAQNTEWLMYWKGVAAASQLFFQDLREVHKSFVLANTERDERKYKK